MKTKLLQLCTVALLLAGATLTRAAIAPAENLLPADTLAFFTVPDCAALRTVNKNSPMTMFWNDPAMKPFHDKFMGKLNEMFIGPMEKDLGIRIDDFLSLPQGQFTIGLLAGNAKDRDSATSGGIILLLDTKSQSGLLKTNLDSLVKKWTAAGRALRTEKIHGLAFTVVPLSTNDNATAKPSADKESAKDASKPKEIFYTQYQSLLVAGNSAKAVDAIAAHLTGGSGPAIADDAVFAADKLSQFRDTPTYYGWFNVAKTIALFVSENKESQDAESAAAIQPGKILEATGLSGLKSASFAVRDQPDGTLANFHLNAPESGRKGLLKILALPAKDAGIPAFVPADAVEFMRVRLDGKQAWEEIQKVVSAISPEYLASLNSVVDVANNMAHEKNPAFDLRTYLFGNLRDDIISYKKLPVGDSLEAFANQPELYLVAVANTDQAIDAIKTLAGMVAPQDNAKSVREFLGHRIYSLTMRAVQVPGATEPQAAPPLLVSSAGGYIAISKDAAILEEYLRSAEGNVKSLHDLAGLAEAASRVGGTSGGLFTFENQRESMRATMKLLKGAAGAGSPLAMVPGLSDWADFSLLPEFESMAKYFYLSVVSASADAEGLTMKVFAPRPPQLK